MSITAVDAINMTESQQQPRIDECMDYVNLVIQQAAQTGARRAVIVCGGNLIRSFTKPTSDEALCINRLRRTGFEVDYDYFGTHTARDGRGRERRAYTYGIIINW